MQGCIKRVCTEFRRTRNHTSTHSTAPYGKSGSVRCFGGDGWNENVGGDDPSVLTADRVCII